MEETMLQAEPRGPHRQRDSVLSHCRQERRGPEAGGRWPWCEGVHTMATGTRSKLNLRLWRALLPLCATCSLSVSLAGHRCS